MTEEKKQDVLEKNKKVNNTNRTRRPYNRNLKNKENSKNKLVVLAGDKVLRFLKRIVSYFSAKNQEKM